MKEYMKQRRHKEKEEKINKDNEYFDRCYKSKKGTTGTTKESNLECQYKF
jgi:hypothetical protein